MPTGIFTQHDAESISRIRQQILRRIEKRRLLVSRFKIATSVVCGLAAIAAFVPVILSIKASDVVPLSQISITIGLFFILIAALKFLLRATEKLALSEHHMEVHSVRQFAFLPFRKKD